MTKGTREKWAARIREWRESGLSAEEFTTGKEYAASSLRVAASQLDAPRDRKAPTEPAVGSASASSERPASVSSKTPRFVPVRTTAAPRGSEIVVEVGGARVRVSRGVDLVLVGEVVRALQGAGR